MGNLLTAALAVVVAVMAWRRCRAAAACVFAVCVWLLYAGAATAYSLWR